MEIPSHDSPYDDALAVAVRAAEAGAAVIRDQIGELENVRAKDPNDFVTETDEAAQAVVLDSLRSAYPNDTVVAEEGTESEELPTAVKDRRWIVDPLDGTTNFMHRVPPFAVSIALQVRDALIVGVVLDVAHDELFTAVEGHGLQVDGEPARVSETVDLGDAFLATGFPYRRFGHVEVFVDVLKNVLPECRGVRRHGAASVDLARLASGRFDGFFETGLDPWDVAAGVLLVREGGGRVTDYQTETGLAPIFGSQVCASNGRIHDRLLDHLSEMKDVRL